jgi:mono/diheme cytochrome c family protein
MSSGTKETAVKETINPTIRLGAAGWRAAVLAAVTIAGAGSAVGAASGNVANGQKLYAAQDCATCHKIGSKGGKIGPDLSKEGTKKRSTQWLVAFFKNPKSTNPKSIMPPVKGSQKDLQDLAAYMLTLKK